MNKAYLLDNNIEVIAVENIGEGVIRVELLINSIAFKRLHSTWDKKIKPVWQDINQHYGGALILDDDKEKDLEAIFKAYLLDNKIKELL